MLEEGHLWSQERQERWSKVRTKGIALYVAKMVGIVFSICLIATGIYLATTWESGQQFPWPALLGIPILGTLSGLIVASATWSASEESFKRTRARQQ